MRVSGRRFWLHAGWIAALLSIGIATALGHSQDPAVPEPEIVGREMCLVCHDISEGFQHTAHGEIECEACHGPGSLHVEAGGDDTLTMAKHPAAIVTGRCLDCHATGKEVGVFKRSRHGQVGVSCISCHIGHPEKDIFGLLVKSTTNLCLDCHGQNAADFRRPFHHPVLEGAMDCVDCHPPHSETLTGPRRVSVFSEQSCVTCHSEKKGPFVFEHAPMKSDGCELCHQSHGSVNPRLLTRRSVAQLCLECHSMTPSLPSSQPPSFHDIRTARFQNCTVCHKEIHGSNSDPAFLR